MCIWLYCRTPSVPQTRPATLPCACAVRRVLCGFCCEQESVNGHILCLVAFLAGTPHAPCYLSCPLPCALCPVLCALCAGRHKLAHSLLCCLLYQTSYAPCCFWKDNRDPLPYAQTVLFPVLCALYSVQEGVTLHFLRYFVLSNSTFADNVKAVFMHDNEYVNVTGVRIVGQSSNYGNPSQCTLSSGVTSCGPITGCS